LNFFEVLETRSTKLKGAILRIIHFTEASQDRNYFEFHNSKMNIMKPIMQIPIRRSLLMVFLVTLFIASCQKGPAGPTGAQGPQGLQGPVGPQGPSGAANEMSYEFTVQSSEWYPESGSPGAWSYTASIGALTQGIIDTGGIYVYWTQNDIQTLMPFTLSGVDFMYITGFPSPGLPAALQVTVTMAGAYATANPSSVYPVIFKVIIDP
jgi:hypothetical protein